MFRIKICGIQTQDEEQMIGRSGADAVGLNFFSGSKRYLDNVARREFRDPGPVGMHRVGVFVNESHKVIQQVCCSYHLTAVQLHGNESPEMVAELAPWKIVKAFRCDGEICQQVISFVEKCEQLKSPLAAVLIDAASNGSFGGSGQVADWDSVRSIRASLNVPVILAGGLDDRNVESAIQRTLVSAVDVATGVERNGRKDSGLVGRFVKTADAALERAREAL